MIAVHYENGGTTTICFLRPVPIVSISTTRTTSKALQLGSQYTITLTGTIIADGGSPFSTGTEGSGDRVENKIQITSTYDHPADTAIADPDTGHRANAIFIKQNMIRELFNNDGQRIEIMSIDTAPVVCYPNVESISFDNGTYINTCNYTIILKAEFLLYEDGQLHFESMQDNPITLEQSGVPTRDPTTAGNPKAIRDRDGGLIESLSQSWTLEPDESMGQTIGALEYCSRMHKLTRTVNITGKGGYLPVDGGTGVANKLVAWNEARNYGLKNFKSKIAYPSGYSVNGYEATPTEDLGEVLSTAGSGWNHNRTHSIDQNAGTFSLTDSWLISKQKAFEKYSMTIGNDLASHYTTATIDGTIYGLSSMPSSGYTEPSSSGDAYTNGLARYHELTSTGTYIGSSVFARVSGIAAPLKLNPVPKSVSVSIDKFSGQIGYNVSFDSRPTNFISGVLSEMVTVDDTYPGDIFAVIPVIGRLNGPILQYIGGRSEYMRTVNIELVLDNQNAPSGSSNTAALLLTKPSVAPMLKDQLLSLIQMLSPATEQGIRKYFIHPPVENWKPKEGRYSISVHWTYELDT